MGSQVGTDRPMSTPEADRGFSSQQNLSSRLAEVCVHLSASLTGPKQDRARAGGQTQRRSQAIRQHHGDKPGLESSWEVNSQVRTRTRTCDCWTSLSWARESAQQLKPLLRGRRKAAAELGISAPPSQLRQGAKAWC